MCDLEIRHCLSILFLFSLSLSSLLYEPFADTRILVCPSFHPLCPSPCSARSTMSSFLFSVFFFFSHEYVRTNERARIYSFPFSPSLSFPCDCHGEKGSIQTPRYYYVMPVDRGSDILCMLMPHNVGFIPLFNIYLFGSFPFSRFCYGQPHRSIVRASSACLLLDLV